MAPSIPPASDTDVEDVAWALQTADALWRRTERDDALVWLRRAAQAAGEADDPTRAVALAQAAQELTTWLEQAAAPAPPVVREATPGPPSVRKPQMSLLDVEIEVEGHETELDTEPLRLIGAPGLDATGNPPHGRGDTADEPQHEPAAVDDSELRTMTPPPMHAVVLNVPKPPPLPRAQRLPPPVPPPRVKSQPEEAPPSSLSASTPGSIPIPRGAVLEDSTPFLPLTDTGENPSADAAVRSPEVLARGFDSMMRQRSAPPVEGEDAASSAATVHPGVPEALPSGDLLPVDEPANVSTSRSTRPPPPAPPSQPTPLLPPAEPAGQMETTPVPAPDATASVVASEPPPSSKPTSPVGVLVEPPRSVPPVAPVAEAPAEPSLPDEHLRAVLDAGPLADLPEEARHAFARAAQLHTLEQDARVPPAALVLVVEGDVEVLAERASSPGAVLAVGEMLRTRGTVDVGHDIQLVVGSLRAVVATWTDAVVSTTFATAPWVESDLCAAADRPLAVAGALAGLLGTRLDDALVRDVLAKFDVTVLLPDETLAERGAPLPGLCVVGVGELQAGGEVLRGGEFVYPECVIGAAAAPHAIKAGPAGALVLVASRRATQELLVTCPPLLEILAGM